MDSETRVGDVVARDIGTVAVFQHHGIDFCCGGKRTLAAAAEEAAVDVDELLRELETAAEAGTGGDDPRPSWVGSLTGLCEHIVEEFHQPLRGELSRLMQLAVKVVNVHGARHPDTLPALGNTLHRLVGELQQHMAKEEQVLFPWIASVERGEGNLGCEGLAPDATLEMPVRVMEMEHEQAGGLLARLRELTHGYRPPEGACTSFRALYDGLEKLERTMHLHVHMENNVLFPRALERAGIAPTDG